MLAGVADDSSLLVGEEAAVADGVLVDGGDVDEQAWIPEADDFVQPAFIVDHFFLKRHLELPADGGELSVWVCDEVFVSEEGEAAWPNPLDVAYPVVGGPSDDVGRVLEGWDGFPPEVEDSASETGCPSTESDSGGGEIVWMSDECDEAVGGLDETVEERLVMPGGDESFSSVCFFDGEVVTVVFDGHLAEESREFFEAASVGG